MVNNQLSTTLQAIQDYAVVHHVPIMENQGIGELVELLKVQQPEKILEIGAAIGFSAIKMTEALPSSTVDTVERDDSRYQKALEFIEQSGFGDRIRIFHADALELSLADLKPEYDAIFIDAAKGQYERFFDKYEALLANGGIIYCDNMAMHGLSDIPLSEVPRRKRTMIRNLATFKEHMLNDARYDTELLSSGDGIMICRKK
ncbi:O-methyltransferase family protein [Planococcus halocryophilus Or1]|uniref:SAM-dependent methyltransferase n=1 Tax=Planococcus halocryophilus TaxID=1215089 RepID=A0A1C7DNB0_9BACL|nr:O-methyltransferase [Planococcus halocryophilus]ANU12858.1 SAM-dependent methyltransferase [Planococcus halocryophilus]EMF45341.1 O-methyltransferase family protein [Planococcus halocryophilus Or1]